MRFLRPTTVAKVLQANGIPPAPDRPSSWRTFLRAPVKPNASARFTALLRLGLRSILVLLVLCRAPAADASPDVLGIVADMKAAYASIQDYTARLVKRERIKGKLRDPEDIRLKFREPGQIYMRWLGPEAPGREILFVKGRDRDRALIHEPRFPISLVTVLTPPDSPLVFQESRHPITDVGLGRLIELLATHTHRALTRGELATREIPPVGPAGPAKAERRLELTTPKTATGYLAHRIVVTIDLATRLPVAVELFDANGDFLASYTYKELIVNPGLTDRDFDPTNPQYTFPTWRFPV
jgi:outer membrane lipoprotein-sorting protein